MGKVLDLTSRLEKSSKSYINSNNNMAEVVDMTAAREEIISDERCEVKRTILTEFMGA